MFKNRFLLVLGAISILSVTMAISYPRSNAPLAASDFYQRHPAWIWVSNNSNASIPVTGASEAVDYFQRHPELRTSIGITIDLTDYSSRHPELSVSTTDVLAASDYFIRHPELKLNVPIEVSTDTTDYFFRQPASAKTIDLTDYFFRQR
jgi:hypothetical protein